MVNRRTKRRLVFVSHSSTDTWIAKQIAREIKRYGGTPFLDEEEISVGADFEEDILSFLNKADELVILLTPWSLKRPYVWAEVGASWARGIPIIVLLLGLSAAEFQAKPGVPVFLKKKNLIQLNEIETYLNQLKQRSNGIKRR